MKRVSELKIEDMEIGGIIRSLDDGGTAVIVELNRKKYPPRPTPVSETYDELIAEFPDGRKVRNHLLSLSRVEYLGVPVGKSGNE